MKDDKHPEPARSTRRDFLKTAGAATAGVLMTDWARSRSFAIAAPRVIGANDRIGFGVIGCGGMGMQHIRSLMGHAEQSNIRITAVCDIYEPRKEAAKALTGATLYHEYQKLIADPAVDAVLIATPEHWHAQMALDAMEAGKDVYLEKPMTRYLDEATKVLEMAKKSGRILQVGSQLCSHAKWRRAKELIREIGKPLWSQTSYCRNTPEGEWNYPIEDAKVGPGGNLDWQAFLGPAKKVPYDPQRFFRWRKYWDYSSGIAGDLYPHRIYPLMIVLGAELPVRVASTGGLYIQKMREPNSTGGCYQPEDWTKELPAGLIPDRDVPDTVHMLADFPSGHTLLVAGCTANEQGLPTMVRGHRASMFVSHENNEIIIRPERPYAEELEEIRERVEGADGINDHEINFIECMRTRKEPTCGPDLAYAGMVTVALAEISFRENKMARFDPQKKTIIRG
ncbi:MAG: Gfo/Idh/MocA family oxidoreductase [Armatimonadetes bacterium]|jgi:predicted dehydrogenase|nr:Gfo/Idh/MocA family oxidoreductase [Armatimonadota bacterium]